MIRVSNRARIAQVHVVLNACAVEHIWVIVEEDRRAYVVKLILALFILGWTALLSIHGSAERTSMRDDLRNAAIFWVILSRCLLSEELILVFKASDFEVSFAIVADDVITHLQFFRQLCILDANKV